MTKSALKELEPVLKKHGLTIMAEIDVEEGPDGRRSPSAPRFVIAPARDRGQDEK